MKIKVDVHRCCSSGNCAMTVPEVFDQSDDDGTVVLLDTSPSEEHRDAVLEAEEMCPSGAISVVADEVSQGPRRTAGENA